MAQWVTLRVLQAEDMNLNSQCSRYGTRCMASEDEDGQMLTTYGPASGAKSKLLFSERP